MVTAVTAVPETGYHFVNWSDGSTANPRTDLDVTANLTVTANFAIDTFTLNYAAGDEWQPDRGDLPDRELRCRRHSSYSCPEHRLPLRRLV